MVLILLVRSRLLSVARIGGGQSRSSAPPAQRAAASCRPDQWQAVAASSSSRSTVGGIMTSRPVAVVAVSSSSISAVCGILPDVQTSDMQSRPRLHPDPRSATSCRPDQWEAFAASSSSRSAVCGILTSSPVVDSGDLFFLQISVLRHLVVQWEAVTASSSSRSAVCDNLSSSPLAASRGLLFLRNRGLRHPVNSAVLSNIRVYFSGFCCPSWVSMLPTNRSFSL